VSNLLLLRRCEGSVVLFIQISIETMTTENVTRVDSALFDNPVKRLGVSGGTAPFFALKLTKEGIEQLGTENRYNQDGTISETYFIGKDLSRAEDEVEFYERALVIEKDKDDEGGMIPLLGFTFEFVGIVTLQETVNGSPISRELLVLKNLHDSKTKLRLLDFKIGDKTADINWRGKSRARACKQLVLDSFTNSTKEGFRLEGFDGEPQVIKSMDPLLDLKIKKKSSRDILTNDKKAQRMAFQRMTGSNVFMHYLDLHDRPADGEKSAASDQMKPSDNSTAVTDVAEQIGKDLSIDTVDEYTGSEVTEIVLHETLCRLLQLSSTCHKVKIPQKWLGSSVALGYDAGNFPPRSDGTEKRIRSSVIVNIFDWGRSELLSKESFDQLSKVEQDDRKTFWDLYMHGIDNLSLYAAKRYYNQFSNTQGWDAITVRVMDYDSSNADDFMGEVTIPLPNPPTNWSEEYTLRNRGKALLRDGSAGGKYGKIKVNISWCNTPETSPRMHGLWHITIDRASNLKAMDIGMHLFCSANVNRKLPDIRSSDPYCLVIARSGSFEFEQMTSVVVRSLNPVWGETIEVPVVSKDSELSDSIRDVGIEVDNLHLKSMLKGDTLHAKEWAKLFHN